MLQVVSLKAVFIFVSSRTLGFALNKQTWNLFRFDYLSRPLKALFLFFPMIFLETRMLYLALSGLPLHATGLMDNAGNQELWVNKIIGKNVVRMLGRSVT